MRSGAGPAATVDDYLPDARSLSSANAMSSPQPSQTKGVSAGSSVCQVSTQPFSPGNHLSSSFLRQTTSTVVVSTTQGRSYPIYDPPLAFIAEYSDNEVHITTLSPTAFADFGFVEEDVRPSITTFQGQDTSEWWSAFGEETLCTRVLYGRPRRGVMGARWGEAVPESAGPEVSDVEGS